MDDQFLPPEHLSDRSKSLWLDLVPRRCRSAGRIVLLQSALEALDRAEQARTELAGASLTTTTATTKAVHVHPLVKVEREARAQFGRLWADLSLGFSQSEDGCDLAIWEKRRAELENLVL